MTRFNEFKQTGGGRRAGGRENENRPCTLYRFARKPQKSGRTHKTGAIMSHISKTLNFKNRLEPMIGLSYLRPSLCEIKS